jgi:hypothetical protein
VALTTKRKRRKPDRKRSTVSVSITWELYDRLDTVANEENAPIASVIAALLAKYQTATKGNKNEAL